VAEPCSNPARKVLREASKLNARRSRPETKSQNHIRGQDLHPATKRLFLHRAVSDPVKATRVEGHQWGPHRHHCPKQGVSLSEAEAKKGEKSKSAVRFWDECPTPEIHAGCQLYNLPCV